MGTIDPKLSDHVWENLYSLKSLFPKKAYEILSNFKTKKDKNSFDDTFAAFIEVDVKLLEKLETERKTIDQMNIEEVIEALEVSAYESFVDKKKYIGKALELVDSSKTNDEKYATLLDNLALIYHSLAEYPKAFSLFNESLDFRKEKLGLDHLDTASSYNNLATYYNSLGDYNQALGFHQKALAIREKTLGSENPDTATSYSGLARTYLNQGHYKKALSLFQKALDVRETVLDKNHPRIATSYCDLADLYTLFGKSEEAFQLIQKALKIQEDCFGLENLEVTGSYDSLAYHYRSQKDYSEALQLHKKSLAIREQFLGIKHPITAASYDNVGVSYLLKDKDFEQAKELFQKSLAIRKEYFAEDSIYLGRSYTSLAFHSLLQSDEKTASPMLEKALLIIEKLLGDEHLETTILHANKAICYRLEGDYSKALGLLQKVLKTRENILGANNFYTTEAHRQLSFITQEKDKHFFLKKENSNLAFKIDKIEIKNFKQYRDFSIDFSPKINIIIGQNATGKTTLLQAIALGVLKENSPDEEKVYKKYIQKDAEKAELTISHNSSLKKVEILKDKRLIKNNYFIPFILSYGSNFFTKYDISADKIVESILTETVNENFSHSIFLDYVDEFWNPLSILKILARSDNKTAGCKKEQLFSVINSFLELESYRLEEEGEEFFFLKKGDSTKLSLEDLSEGYRGNVLLITDMVVKILGVGSTPKTIEGIILIDEFDKHLHPKWQSQLVAKLTETFPRVQFIMTTHNPMSILDRESNEITIIKEVNNKVVAVRGSGTKTMDVSTVLLEYFGVTSTISESMQEKVNTFNRLKLQKKLTKEEKIELQKVEAFLGNTVASNFIYDRKYLRFLEYIQKHKDLDFNKYEQINDEEMGELLKDFGDFFND